MAKKIVNVLEGAAMTNDGLSFKGTIITPVAEKCDGCDRQAPFEDKFYCSSYSSPENKWASGICNFATHVRVVVDKTGQVSVNPLKASKRAAKGR